MSSIDARASITYCDPICSLIDRSSKSPSLTSIDTNIDAGLNMSMLDVEPLCKSLRRRRRCRSESVRSQEALASFAMPCQSPKSPMQEEMAPAKLPKHTNAQHSGMTWSEFPIGFMRLAFWVDLCLPWHCLQHVRKALA